MNKCFLSGVAGFYRGFTAVFGRVDGGLIVFGKCSPFLYNSYIHKWYHHVLSSFARK